MALCRAVVRAVPLALALAAVTAPAPAAAATERVEVQSGTLVYWSDDAPQEDWITVTAGGSAYPGKVILSETRSPSGSVGPGCVSIGGSSVACSGVTGLDLRVKGLADRVTVDIALAATVDGGDGDDQITGGTGDDTLLGGAGADTIDARDGIAESVDCGAGADLVQADEGDAVLNCETVDRPAVPAGDPLVQPPPNPVAEPGDDPALDPGTDPGAGQDETAKRTADPVADGGERRIRSAPGADVDGDGIVDDRDGDGFADPGQGLAPVFDFAVAPGLKGPVRLVTRSVAVSSAGIATFEVACAVSEPAPCAGDLFVDPTRKVRKGRRAARVRARMARRGRLGRSPFVIAQGKRHKLDVKLSAPARKALGLPTASRKARASRRGRSLRARVTVIQKGKRAQTTVVTLRGGA